MRQHLTRARLVLPNETLEDASLLVEDGYIAAINPDNPRADSNVDLQGDWLMPGMVDLHCDAIEKEVEPRSRVTLPLDFACLQVDRRNAAAGITTPYHAISFAHAEWGVRNNDTAAQLVRAVRALKGKSLVDNRVHVRYELTDVEAVPYIMDLLDEGCVDLLSIMDHTPGQGQFHSLDIYVAYMTGNHGISKDAALEQAERKMAARREADDRVLALMERARMRGVPTASHDDDDPQRIATMRRLGASMSEFPVNLETARAAHDAGLATIVGAPNVVRGKSQSGCLRALDAIEAGVGDCLCADYLPAAMLAAVFTLIRQAVLEPHQAVKLVSANPARAAKHDDRGEIVAGKRADLIRVGEHAGQPLVMATWSAGRQTFSTRYRD